MRNAALCVLIVIVLAGCRRRPVPSVPESSPLVRAYAGTVEKVKADLEAGVSDEKIAEDIATAKAADAALDGANLKRESIYHLLRAFSFYQSASWSLRDTHRAESKGSGDQASMDRRDKDFRQSKATADAEMDLARQDLAAGR